MRRLGIILPATLLGLLLTAGPALACGGLIGPNGAVNLLRTTTFAGYHDGVEHYVTSFQFAGGGGAFGSITPLPAVPTSVEKGGDWTLQRLIRETNPLPAAPSFSADAARGLGARRRGAHEGPDRRPRHHRPARRRRRHRHVGEATTASGSRPTRRRSSTSTPSAARSSSPPPSTPTLPRSAASRSATGPPVHITIPTDNPWVPLRILALGKTGSERIEADVFLLTDGAACPAPDADRRERHAPRPQRRRQRTASSTTSGPTGAWSGSRRRAWLTKVAIDSSASRPLLRPRDRRQRRRGSVPGRCRPRAARRAVDRPRRSTSRRLAARRRSSRSWASRGST